MVTYKLMITADCENVSSIEPMNGCNDDLNFIYYFKLHCENCGEKTVKETCATLGYVAYAKRDGYVHLVQKCKLCGRVGTIELIAGAGRPLSGENCDSGQYALLMGFKWLGLEPVEYYFGGAQWRVTSTKGTVFENVDLSEGDWVEYDEDEGMPVSVLNLKSRVDVVKRSHLRGPLALRH